MTIVISDGDGEGIVAVEVGVWCVSPGACFRIDGGRTVVGPSDDGEVSGIGETISGISS